MNKQKLYRVRVSGGVGFIFEAYFLAAPTAEEIVRVLDNDFLAGETDGWFVNKVDAMKAKVCAGEYSCTELEVIDNASNH
jgi:hypothetical protein